MPCYFHKTYSCLQVADAVSANLVYSSRQLSTPHISTVLPRPGALHQFSLQGGRRLLKVIITERRDSHEAKTCKKGQTIQNFSQRHKNRKLGISCLEAKPNLELEGKKWPNANEKISWRLPTRALGPLWSQSGASSGSPAAAMMVSVFPMLCYKYCHTRFPAARGESHSCRGKGTWAGDRSSQQTQGNCCISMSWPKQRLFGRMKLLMSLRVVKYNR